MNPRPGLFSVDTWWIVATYTRNVFINLLVILPFVVSLVLLIRLLVLLYRAVALEMQINLIEVAARSLSIKLAVDELQSLVIPRHGS
jgi:hypothetical protein